jgi:hypothetical protein
MPLESTSRLTSGRVSCLPVSLLDQAEPFVANRPDDFCLRACVDGPNAPAYCQHIYDVCKLFIKVNDVTKLTWQ